MHSTLGCLTILSIAATVAYACDAPILSRAVWGSSASLPNQFLPLPTTIVFFHHTDTPQCFNFNECSRRVKSMQSYHVSLGWSDIGYNFLIGNDGNVYEGRGWDRQGVHTKGHNTHSVSIAFIGNYNAFDPSPQMLNAARQLIQCGIEQGKVSPSYGLYGHRDGSCTDGPGTHFYYSLRSWPHWHAQGEIARYC